MQKYYPLPCGSIYWRLRSPPPTLNLGFPNTIFDAKPSFRFTSSSSHSLLLSQMFSSKVSSYVVNYVVKNEVWHGWHWLMPLEFLGIISPNTIVDGLPPLGLALFSGSLLNVVG